MKKGKSSGIEIETTDGAPIYLINDQLRDYFDSPMSNDEYRYVKRDELARILASKNNVRIMTYIESGEKYEPYHVYFGDETEHEEPFCIGCKHFDAENFKKIRAWVGAKDEREVFWSKVLQKVGEDHMRAIVRVAPEEDREPMRKVLAEARKQNRKKS